MDLRRQAEQASVSRIPRGLNGLVGCLCLLLACVAAGPTLAGTVTNTATGNSARVALDLTGATVNLDRIGIDLSVTKVADTMTPNVGTNIEFTVTVANAAGEQTATGVVVRDLLGSGYAYVSDDSASTSTTYDEVAGDWTVGTINAGASVVLKIVATVLGTGTYANSAEVIAADQSDFDSTPGDGMGDDFATITPTPAPRVNLSLTKVADDMTPDVGASIVFTLELTNAAGFTDATNVAVTDALPAGYAFVSAAGDGAYSDVTDAWTLASVSAGSTASIDITVTVLGAGSYQNDAEVTAADQADADETFGDGMGADFATVTPTPTPLADLSLTKVADDMAPAVGTNIVFTLELTNATGFTDATNVVVTDVLPSGYTFVSAAGDGAYSTATDEWTLASVAAGSTASIDITVTVLGSGSYQNDAEVTAADQADPDETYGDGMGADFATVTPAPAPRTDLSLTKVADNMTPAVGSNVVFTLELTNAAGFTDATGVVVTDVLPAGYTFVSAVGDGAYSTATDQWTLASVAAGGTASIDITVTVLGSGSYQNDAEVTAADQIDADETFDDGMGDDFATVTPTPVPRVDLSLTKVADNMAPDVGTNIVFTLELTNAAGFTDATNLVVTDALPSGYAFVSAAGDGAYSAIADEWTLASLAAGATASIDITVTVLGTGGYQNDAEVTAADQADADEVFGDGMGADFATVTPTPTALTNLSLTKVADDIGPAVGSNIVFTLELTNVAGYSTATNVVVTDVLPTGYAFVGAAGDGAYSDVTDQWTLPSLAGGATASIDITVTVLGAGAYQNDAEVTAADQADADETFGDGMGADFATVTPVPLPRTNLSLTKVADSMAPDVGSTLVFTLELTNGTGFTGATNVVVTDALPTGYAFVSAAGDGAYSAVTDAWTLAFVAAGTTASIDITVTVLGAGGYQNDAEVTAADQTDADETFGDGMGADFATVTPVPVAQTNLSLTKAADNMTPDVGTNVVFTLELTNAAGFSNATNVVITDVLPGGYAFVGSAGDGAYSSVTDQWTLASLAAGATASMDITVTVLGTGSYQNDAEVTAADQSDADETFGDGMGADFATVTPTPTAKTDLSLTKVADNMSPAVGANVVFTLELTNGAGFSAGSNVVVTDALPTGYTFVSATGDGAYSAITDAWTLASIAPGATASIDITVTVLGSGTYRNDAEVTAADQTDTDETFGDGMGADFATVTPTPSPRTNLSLTKVADDMNPDVGSNVVFTLELTNATGFTDATNVVVTDVLPSGYAFVSAAGDGAYSTATDQWTLASVAGGATASIDITVTVLGSGTYQNDAEVTAADQTDADETFGDGMGADFATVTPAPVAKTNLSLTKVADNMTPDVGTNIVFTLELTNAAGFSAASNLVITDALPAGYAFVSAVGDGAYSAVTDAWTLPGLAAGATAAMDITVTVLGSGSYQNDAEVTAADQTDADETFGDGMGADFASVTPTPTAMTNLSLTKVADNMTPDVGTNVVFTLELTNAAGYSPATTVVVTDALPTGYAFVGASGDGAYSAVTDEWTLPSLAGGATASIDITVTVLGAGSYQNDAEVTSADQADADETFGDGMGADFATVTPVPVAKTNLSLTKIADNMTPDVGANIVFTLELTNAAGFTDATNVVITDALPAGYAFVGAAGDGAYSTVTDQWTLAGLAAGATASIDITVTVLGAGSYRNDAEVTAADQTDADETFGDGMGADFASVTPVPVAKTDLSLTKVADNMTPDVGSNVVFTLELTNAAGFSAATNVTVTDVLPSGYAFVNAAGDGAYSAVSDAWTLASLAAGATASIDITVTVLGTGSYQNDAEVTAADQTDADETFADGMGADFATVTPVPNPLTNLSLTKVADTMTPNVGSNVVFTLELTNAAGFTTATGVVITDVLPAGYAFVGAAGDGAYSTVTDEWTLASVPGGTTASIDITVTVLGSGSYQNDAEVTAADQTDRDETFGDGMGADFATTTPMPTATVDLSLAKFASDMTPSVGTMIVFTLDLTNATGFSTATNVQVTDVLAAGYGFVSAAGDGSYDDATGVWGVASLAAGSTASIDITVTVLGSGSYANAAEVTAADQADTDDVYGDGMGEDFSTTTPTPVPTVDLSLTKVADDLTPDVGTNVVFTVEVSNAAGFTAGTNLQVTDVLAAGYSFVSAAGDGSYDDASGIWDIPSLAAGATASIDITATVLGSGSYQNDAEVTAADQVDANDTFGDGMGADFATVTPTPTAIADLSLTKAVDDATPSVGANVVFTLEVSNAAGFSPATNVQVTDVLPSGYNFVGAAGDGSYDDATGVWDLASVAAGTTASIDITVTVLGTGTYQNDAEVTAADQADANDTYGDGMGADFATSTPVPVPTTDLSLTKNVDNAAPAVGTQVVFTLDLSNAADVSTATNVRVTDLVPTGYSFVSAVGDGSYDDATGFWDVASLAAGATASMDITLNVLGSGSYQNDAEVTSADLPDLDDTYGDGMGEDFATNTPMPLPRVDLGLTKSADTTTPDVGDPVVFTLELTNAAGFNTATNVQVTDILASGYSFVSAVGAGSYDDATGVWDVPSLAAGATASIDITVTVLGSGTYVNDAEVTAADQPDANDTYGDGMGDDFSTVTTAPNAVIDLSLVKSVDVAAPNVGDNIVFTLDLTNAGGFSAASNVQVTDVLPSGYAFVSATGDGSYDDATGVWDVVALAAGSTASIDITVAVLGSGTYQNDAEVTAADQPDADDTFGDGMGADFSTSTPTPVPTLDLALSKSVDDPTPDVGTNVVFTLDLSNAADFSAGTNIQVTDLLPAGYAFVSAAGDGSYDDATGVWDVASLAAGASASIDITATVLGAGPYQNDAEVTAADQGDTDDTYGDGMGEDFSSSTPAPVAVVDLALTKVVDVLTPNVGNSVVFTLGLTNATGFSTATNVQVTDVLPSGYVFVSAAGDGSYDDATGLWDVASLAADASASIDITVTVLGTGSYQNDAEVTAADQSDTDDTFGDGMGADFGSATTTPTATLDLSLTKVADDTTPAVGSNVVFTLELTNAAGFSTGTNIQLSDLLPSGYAFVSAAGDGSYDDATGVWDVTSLAGGATASIDITVTVLGSGSYQNDVEVTAADQADADDTYGDGMGADFATSTPTPVPTVDLSLSKSADTLTPAVGTSVVFTLELDNATGFSPATNVEVTDPVPSGYAFVGAAGDGTYDDATGVWDVPALAAGATATLDITVTVLGSGTYQNVAEVTAADQGDADDTFGDGMGNDYATATPAPVAMVDLSLVKSVDDATPDVGANVVFTLDLSNAAGFSSATNVQVTDLLPSGYAFVSAAGDGAYDDATGVWDLASVAAGTTASIDITVTVLGAGSYQNDAEVTAADQGDPDDTYGDGMGEDFSTTTPTPTPTVDLALSKVASTSTPAVGTQVVFTLDLSNAAGFSPATNIQVTDLLPTGYAFVSAVGDGTYADATGVWNVAALAAGATASIDITATVLGSGSYQNDAEVTAADQSDTDDVYGDGMGEDFSSTTPTPVAMVDLSLTKGVDTLTPDVGSSVVFTLSLSNAASFSTATNVQVTDVLPAGYAFVSSVGDGSYDDATGVWDVPSLAGGATATIDLTVTVLGTGAYRNDAEVTAADQADTDDIYGDGMGDDFDTVTPTPNAVADLSLTKVVDVPNPGVGSNVVFTLQVSNAVGFSPSTNIQVADLLDAGYAFVSATGDGSYDDATGIWDVASLAPGATASIDITATILGSGAYLNQAEVTAADQPDADDTYGDGMGADFASVTPVPTAALDLSLSKTADDPTPDVGGSVVFTLDLTNATGFSDGTNIQVTDVLPSGYSFVSAVGDGSYDDATGVWDLAALSAGATASIDITVTVLGSGVYQNDAEVTAADQPDFDDTYGDGAGEDFSTATPNPTAVVDLSLTKVADNPTPNVGTSVVFTLALTNAAGYSDGTNVEVTDVLPSGYSFVSAVGDGSYDDATGVWSLPSVLAGSTATLNVTTTVLGAGSYQNDAEVTAADQGDADDTFGDGMGADFATVTPVPVPIVDLSLSKTADNLTPAVGATVVFTLDVTNAAGFSPATGVQVTDLLPSGYAFVSAVGDGSYDDVSGVWTVGALAAGATSSVDITTTVLGSGVYRNDAEVTAADQGDADDIFGDGMGADFATVTPVPTATADLSLSKTADDMAPSVGTNVVFTLEVANAAGFSDTTGIQVTDVLPAGYAFVSASGDGSYDDATGVWYLASVAAGTSASIDITATVLGAGSYQNNAEVTAADQGDTDDVYGDGMGEDFATVTPVPAAVVDLALTKTASSPTPAVGTNVVFTLGLTNETGYSTATSVQVNDVLPSGYSYVSSTGDGSYDDATGVWDLSSLAAGASASIDITATVLGSGVYQNDAEVTAADQPDADDTYGDGLGEDFATTTPVPTAMVDFSLTKVADTMTPDVGMDVAFTLELTNAAGFSDATGVQVGDLLAAGYSFVSAVGDGSYDDATGVWDILTLPAGSTASLTITATVLGAGPYQNDAEVTAADQPDSDDVYGDGMGEDFATVTPTPTAVVDLSLVKSVDNPTPDVGTDVTFTLQLSNAAGFSDATNIQVADLLPAGYRFVSASGDGVYDDATGVWDLVAVPAGSTLSIDITATVLGAVAYTNAAEVTAADQSDADDVFGDGMGEDFSSVTPTPTAIVDLSLTKVADSMTPAVGSNVTFTLTLNNAVDYSEATNVQVTDVLSAGYAFVSAAGDGSYDDATGIWTVPSVAAGSAAAIDIVATVLGSGSYQNDAEVTAADQGDADDTYGDGMGADFATVTPTPTAAVDLSLTKVVDNPTPDVGASVVFTLELSNAAGFSAASTIQVTDLLAPGYSFVSAVGDGAYSDVTGVWDVPALAAGATASIDITATVLGVGPYRNDAEVTAADQVDTDDVYGDGAGEDFATVTPVPNAVVDLSLTKMADTLSPEVGSAVVFTLQLSNAAGFSAATNVQIQDVLPSGYAFVSAVGDGSYDDATGVWSIGSVAAGASASMDITLTVLGAGAYRNDAEVVAADQSDTDDTYGDGAGEDFATATPVPAARVDLALTKTADTPTPNVGADVVFTLELTNAADFSDATGIQVTDVLPSGYTFVSAAGDGSYDDATGVWAAGDLAAGATATLNITATVLGAGNYQNDAEVTAADQQDIDDVYGDGMGEDFSSVTPVPNATVDLAMAKTVDNPTPTVGSNAVFTLVVSNAAGFSDATGVIATDVLPAGYSFVSAAGDGSYDDATGIWVVGALGAGATASLDITVTVLGAGPYRNAAEVTAADQADADDIYGDGMGSDFASVTPVPDARVDLSLTKVADEAAPSVGTDITFTLTLQNEAGFSDATSVEVTDLLPAGYAFVSAAGDGSYDDASGIWAVGTLAAGASASIDITVTVLGSGPYQNAAEVSGADQLDVDDTYGDGAGEDRDIETPVPSAAIDLDLTKVVDLPTPAVAGTVIFTLSLSNAAGFSEATGVQVTDSLPSGYAFVSASGDGSYDDLSGIWTLASVPAGSTATLDITATVLPAGDYTNAAEVTAADQVDFDDVFGDGSGDDFDTAATTPSAVIDVALGMAVDNATPTVGSNVVFTLTLNSEPNFSDGTNLVIANALPSGYAFVSAAGDGSYDSVAGLWSVPALAAGGSASMGITVTVLGTGDYLNEAEVSASDQAEFDDVYGDGAGEDYASEVTTPSSLIDLSLTKTVDNATPAVGANVVFSITVSNAGGRSDASGVTVQDLLPSGYVHVSDDGAGAYDPATGVWTVGAVPSGGSVMLQITARVAGSGNYDNTAEVTAADQTEEDDTFGDGAGNDFASASTTPTAMIDLSLAKNVDNTTPGVDAPVVFTLDVANAGGFSDATGVLVEDALPDGYTFVSASGDGTYDEVAGMWTLPMVPAGSSVSIQITATVNGAGQFLNRAEVMSADQPDRNDVYGDGAGDDFDTAAATPVGDAIRLVKTAHRNEVVTGDVVGYTLRAENILSSPAFGVDFRDEIPGGFKYVEDSARILRAGSDGTLGTSDDVSSVLPTTGVRPVILGPVDFAADEIVEISYLLRVGTGALPGRHDNVATPLRGGLLAGNVATAGVDVIVDATFDLTTIIGKVFEDNDGNGLQGLDDKGVQGAMVALDDGTYVITDEHGRFHFPAVRPGQRLVKLNLRSMPPGTRSTNDVRRVLWLTPGLMARANFGVVLDQSVASIGAKSELGVRLSATENPVPVSVVGSAQSQTLLVNGKEVRLPRADVGLRVQDLTDSVEILGDTLTEPVRFSIDRGAYLDIDHWAITIRDRAGNRVRTLRGDGAPPEELEWNGHGDDGTMIAGGEVYLYQLELNMIDGTRAASPNRLLGVNRSQVIALDLTGNAFETAKAVLGPAAKEALADAASVIREHPEEIILVEGHTDSAGSDEYNMDLSRRRAESAVEYLTTAQRLPRDRFVLNWYGESRPKASNRLPEGMAINRRVELRGQGTEKIAAEVLQSYLQAPEVRINDEDIPVGRHGRFRAQVEPGPGDGLRVRMADEQGRSTEALVPLPRIELDGPESGEVLLPIGGEASGCVAVGDAVTVRCVLQGSTDPGNTLELDGEPIKVDAAGRFEAEVALPVGERVVSLLAKNPEGYTRIHSVEFGVNDRDADGQKISIGQGIPELTINLPPEGIVLHNPLLALSGKTSAGNRVEANGTALPVGADGAFAGSVELPRGNSRLVVTVTDPRGRAGSVERDVQVAKHDLFLLAFADGRFGQLDTSGAVEGAALGSDPEEFYTEGRVAFYLKGVIAGKYLITSAFDSAKNQSEYLFKDIDFDENQRLLTNLDPDKFYPVYGDNSSVTYDAQSQGKFYLALDSDAISALVGNYPLALTDTELASYQRTLYGARFAYESVARTKYGQPDTEVVVFTAEVNQAHIRDELRATGGSLYYLSHRDVIEGSEQVTLIVRDKNTGVVLSRERQRQNLDYTIKYEEGRVMFQRSISSVIQGGSLVDQQILSGHPVFLQVDYETRVDSFDKTVNGGRVRQQVGDHVAVGGTYVDDELEAGSYELQGVDAEIRVGQNSRLVAEYAESEGADAATWVSNDGGVSYTQVPAAGVRDGSAFKAAAELDVGEWFGNPDRYRVGLYFKDVDAGFSASGNLRDQGTRNVGLNATLDVTDSDTIRLRHDQSEVTGSAGQQETTISSVEWEHKQDTWGVNVEYFDTETEGLGGVPGADADTAYGAAAYWSQLTKKLTTRLQYQHTLTGVDNDQTSLALQYQALPSLSLEVKGTDGRIGTSAQAGAVVTVGESNIYLTQRQAEDAAGDKDSTILGARSPIGSSSQVYTEYQNEDSDQGNRAISLVGIQRQWNLAEGFRFLLSGENADVNSSSEDTTRTALSAALIYGGTNGLSAVSKNEIRYETGDTRRVQLLTFNQLDYKLSDGFTLLAKYRYSKTRDRLTDRTEARFEERSLGVAFRPVRHDRFNAIGRYTRLVDVDPLTESRSIAVNRKMDVVSLETVYQLNDKLEWVTKEATRFQEERIGDAPAVDSTTFLAIQRFNYNLYRQFDLGMEYRILALDETDDRRQGWLTEAGWRIRSHVRFGLGYNFTDFSDSEFSQNDYSVRGWFFRIQGMY